MAAEYVTCWRAPRCNMLITRSTEGGCADPWRADFCRRFGTATIPSSSCADLCADMGPGAGDRCPDIHDALRSLDYFTAPPLFQRGTCNRPVKIVPAPDCRRSGRRSTGVGFPQLPECYKTKPNPYEDTICGLQTNSNPCNYPKEAECDPSANTSTRCGFPELPFQVYLADTRTPEEINPPPKVIDQVDRCLHPSKFRYLDTSYRTDFLDFFKIKSSCELNLYRSGLAIDHGRPRLTLSADGSPQDAAGDGRIIVDPYTPLTYNARPIKYRTGSGAGRQPMTFTVSVPGPITIG